MRYTAAISSTARRSMELSMPDNVGPDVSEVMKLEQANNKLLANEQFQAFLKQQKEIQEAIEAAWVQIQERMEATGTKSIKGDWGSITLAERINWEYDPTMLPPKYFKKVVDTKKLTDTFRLEGREPKGATAKYSKYLMKRLK